MFSQIIGYLIISLQLRKQNYNLLSHFTTLPICSKKLQFLQTDLNSRELLTGALIQYSACNIVLYNIVCMLLHKMWYIHILPCSPTPPLPHITNVPMCTCINNHEHKPGQKKTRKVFETSVTSIFMTNSGKIWKILSHGKDFFFLHSGAQLT